MGKYLELCSLSTSCNLLRRKGIEYGKISGESESGDSEKKEEN